MMKTIHLPFTEQDLLNLKSGEEILLSGVLFTARDAAHKRLVESLDKNEKLPIDLIGNAVYYVGPTPAQPGQIIGSCGPTSSYRMDPYSMILMRKGLRLMLGKGDRGSAFQEVLKETKSVYLITVGGIGALLSKCVKSARVVAYPELGAEAIYELVIEDFPAIVMIDSTGLNVFE